MANFNLTGLSARQKNILKFIESFISDHGYPPTIREIGEAVDIASTSVVNYNLNKLVDRGFIERAPKVSRGLWLTVDTEEKEDADHNQELRVRYADPNSLFAVPLVGKIVASQPVLAFEDFGYNYDESDLIEVP
ncbi:MAG: hypothetical protein JXA10_09960, partial [Anaerolineae bacterium]|nr:hypothetical protein [Anaerolineae bacterium]